MSKLREAAQAVLDRWDSPAWEWLKQGPTAALMADLRAALAEPTVPSDCTDSHQPVAWYHVPYPGNGISPVVSMFQQREPSLYGAVVPLYTAPPQRKPLAEWQINDLMADIDPEDVDSWSFRQGVYAAEKHHGIKP